MVYQIAIEVRARMSNSIPYKTVGVITYPCPHISWSLLVNGGSRCDIDLWVQYILVFNQNDN